MAAHRYWRLQSLGGNINDSYRTILFREFEFRDAPGGPNLSTDPDKALGSVARYTTAEDPRYAFDGNLGTFAQLGQNFPGDVWIGYDFGAGNEKDIVEVRLKCWDAYSNRTPRNFTIEWSDDLVTWTIVWFVWAPDSTGWGTLDDRVFTKPNPTNKRYWQVLSTKTQGEGSHVACAHLRMIDPEGNILVPADTVAVPDYTGSYPASRYADADPKSFYHTNDQVQAQRFGYDFGSDVTVSAVSFMTRGDGFAQQSPVRGAMICSDDNGTSWLAMWNFTSPATWEPGETRVLGTEGYSGPKVARRFRLKAVGPSQAGYDQFGFAALKFFEGATRVSGPAKNLAFGSSMYNTDYQAPYANDDSNDTEFVVHPTDSAARWIEYRWFKDVFPDSYLIRARQGYPQESPTGWTIDAYDEAAGEWVTCATEAGQTGWTGGMERTYSMTPPSAEAPPDEPFVMLTI